MYRVIAGIDTKTDQPGYKQIVIKPTLGGKFQNASADYETNYGKVSSHWKLDSGMFSLDVEIPANTMATVYIPANVNSPVSEGDKPVASNPEIKVIDPVAGYTVVNVGSGVYHFTTTAPQP
jgi:alpha-L-rhamnosidase